MKIGKPQSSKERIILALDVDDLEEAEKLVIELKDYVGYFKIGLQLFTSYGFSAIKTIKDNGGKVTLGTVEADQQALLSNNWFKWFDKFVNALVKPSSLIGNSGVPVLKPEIDQLLIEYKLVKDTFLSKNVFIVDNKKIKKLK